MSKEASATRGSIETTATRVLTISSFVTWAALGERRVELGGVAIVIVERDIVRDVVVELRRAGLGRLGGVGHGGQRIDVDHHGFGGVARLRQRLGHHEGHGIADKAHLVGHQRRAVGLQQRRAVAVLQRQSAGEGGVVGLLARSAPVQIPSTPGIALAAAVSMPRITPWAWEERTIHA